MSSMTHTPDTTETASNHRDGVRDHALAALSDTDADGEIVKATMLREHYRHQPTVSLEDTLELNAVVEVPEAGPLNDRIETVLSEIANQYNDWRTTSPVSPASENTSDPTTEGH